MLTIHISEMKLAAITAIYKLEDENELKEILAHLNKLINEPKTGVYNLSKHIEKVNEQYADTLKKLAQ